MTIEVSTVAPKFGVSMANTIDVSFSCVRPVIDHEFRHNIVKVAVDPTTLTML